MKNLHAAAAFILLAFACTSALAAEQKRFEPAYFADYAPQTALDMVGRIPGFSLSEGENVRGFGGAAGNVLIDGNRPSTKSSSLREALAAIPASAVERIELSDAASLGVDAGGSALVVNVVRKAQAKAAGTASIEANVQRGDRVRPYGELAWSGPIGAGLTATVQAKGGQNQGEYLVGREKITDAQGRILEMGPNRDRRDNWSQNISGTLSGGATGREFNVNGKIYRENFRRDYEIDATDPSGVALRFDRGAERRRQYGFEIGGDVKHPGPFGTALALTALLSRNDERQPSGFVTTSAVTPGLGFASSFLSEGRSGEQLARSTISGKAGAHTWETGLEVAYNFLNANQRYAEGPVGQVREVPLSIAKSLVEEVRGEFSARDSWAVSQLLTVEIGLKLETSTIRQSGDATKERSFFYPKPSLAITWRPAEGWTVRARAEQLVGQLDFGDFVSSNDVGDAFASVGNPELAPDRTLRVEAGIERRWGSKNVIELTLINEQITDAVGFIPINNEFDAIGNIGDARRWGLDLDTTYALDDLGLRNGEFSLQWSWRDSAIIDPVTQRSRVLGGGTNRNINIQLRQDVIPGRLSWNIDYGRGGSRHRFALSDTIVWPGLPRLGVYVDYVVRPGTTLTLGFDNPGGATARRSRSVYNGSRANDQLAFTAARERRVRPGLFAKIATSF